MTRTRTLSLLALAGVAALALPLRSDGGDGQCTTTTVSYDVGIGTSTGDASFFKLPTGPAAVMLLLDNSGSMNTLVQCTDDNSWGDASGSSKCLWPTSTELPATDAASNVASGTCAVAGTLAWMNLKDPADSTKALTKATAPTLVDPGLGTNTYGLKDTPTWGSTCTGTSCLFNVDSSYPPYSWTETTATPVNDCKLRDNDGKGAVIKDSSGREIAADAAACKKCLDDNGFYFIRGPDVCTRTDRRGNCTAWAPQANVRLAGWWLNANPPKFMTARKAIKQLAWMDPATSTNLDNARLGLALFNPTEKKDARGTWNDDTRIVVPIGPSKASSFPVNKTAMASARQFILDALNHLNWPANTRMALASGGTPAAPSLAYMGQYFAIDKTVISDPGGFYTPSAAGMMQAPWASGNCVMCWGCQTNATIVVTDGSPNTEGATPATMTSYAEASYASNCGAAKTYAKCVSPTNGGPTYLPRVAAWLAATENDLDPKGSTGAQTIITSAIGFGILDTFGSSSNLWNILNTTANMGGGKAYDATTPKELSDAIIKAVADVADRANSFSAPAASSLSTIHTAASEAFITRFKPNDFAAWEGHVFQGLLFDEYLNGCDPTKTPTGQAQVDCGTPATKVYPNFNGNATPDGLSICTDVFLVDKTCAEVTEDAKTGEFLKKGSGGKKAELVWDAGLVLSDSTQPAADPDQPSGYRTAREGKADSRKIYTVLPGTTTRIELTTANAASLQPYLNLDKAWCATLLSDAKLCGGTTGIACPTAATITATQMTDCAKAVISYVRGFDVLDADKDNCGGPGVKAGCPLVGGAATDGEERDRPNDGRTEKFFWKLGDVFHSSPVLVKPPATEALCDTGYENQCLATLRSPAELDTKTVQTPIETYDDACHKGSDAYEAYRYDNRDRQRLVLVGANDGMLHAFDAGSPKKGSLADTDCVKPYGPGSGGEVWAFIPPDLLPKLRLTLYDHTYMVDGSTMVRDVWTDVNKDGVKQRDEYRTVAVMTERGGGTQFTALDVTTPGDPQFLWSFPPPGSQDQRYMGQAWSDFAPRPPPIGPVRLEVGADDKDPKGRKFVERWVVMINGGYDPGMALGAAVWMVDAMTGSVIWRYTNDDFKKQFGYGTGTSMFPVPGAVALADIGDTDRARFDNDGFFDTASWGDLGGSLFVARFHEVGTFDPDTKRVKNWFVGRTFEEQRLDKDLQNAAGRSEFHYMPELTYEPVRKAMHAYLGSGNREKMMQQKQECGPDNLLSCCKAGCSAVTATTTTDFGACRTKSQFTCATGQLNNAPLDDTCSATTAPVCAAAPGNAYKATLDLSFTCGTVTAAAAGTVSCDANGVCSKPVFPSDDDIGGKYDGTCTHNRFFGVLAYGAYAEKKFATSDEASAFEKARYTDVAFTSDACASTGKSCSLIDTTSAVSKINQPDATCPKGGKCTALNGDPGWFYEYGVNCPAKSCADAGACSPEKTGSGALITFGCVLWNGFQPVGATGGTDPCTGTVGAPVAYGYATDYVSGVPKAGCGYTYLPDTTLYRGQERASVSPPSAPLLRITAGAKGGVHYGGLQIDPGASPEAKSTGERSDFAESVYWLEVDRQAHACRHDAATATTSCQ